MERLGKSYFSLSGIRFDKIFCKTREPGEAKFTNFGNPAFQAIQHMQSSTNPRLLQHLCASDFFTDFEFLGLLAFHWFWLGCSLTQQLAEHRTDISCNLTVFLAITERYHTYSKQKTYTLTSTLYSVILLYVNLLCV